MQKFSLFESLLLQTKNELGLSIMLLLAWIAASDGVVDESEVKRIFQIYNSTENRHVVEQIIAIAKQQDTDAIQLASEVVSRSVQREKAELFLAMAIGVAVADGFLRPTENHILRYIADLLGLSKTQFNNVFIEVTGKNIPDPADLSSANYWRSLENQKENAEKKRESSERQNRNVSNSAKLRHAYAVLGLEVGADKAEIKLMYRRLSKLHHPDRFVPLGEEAVAAATVTFQRISDAYTYLMKNA